jgi:cytochrome c oxidase subunit 2
VFVFVGCYHSLLRKSSMWNMRVTSNLAFGRILLWSALALSTPLTLLGCRAGSTDAATRGQELFQTCVPCHQQDGSGNPAIGAPNIAGMNDWYVEAQLEHFRNGARGAQFTDIEGMRMRPMAISLDSDEDVKAVAHYVASMIPVRHAASLPGNADAGAAAFATCAACHGVKGSGNPDMKAPRIAGTDDWYLAAQLRKFKSGIRGTSVKDPQGRLMRPMARTLGDDDAVRNVVAYIGTLKP